MSKIYSLHKKIAKIQAAENVDYDEAKKIYQLSKHKKENNATTKKRVIKNP